MALPIEEGRAVDGALIGSLAHRALARVLYANASGEASWIVPSGPSSMKPAWLGATGDLGRGRQGSVASYLRRGHPGPGWQLAAAEFPLGRAVADLVYLWIEPDAAQCVEPPVLVDEYKSGLSHRALSTARTREQLLQLLIGGRARWGDRLVGVRLVVPALRITHLIRNPADILTITETLS